MFCNMARANLFRGLPSSLLCLAIAVNVIRSGIGTKIGSLSYNRLLALIESEGGLE